MRILSEIERARSRLIDWQAPSRTALRIPRDRRVPPPRAFAMFGSGSWIVPPARIEGTQRIELGTQVIVLERCGIDVGPGARLRIGDRTRIAPGVEICCRVGVTIGAAVSTSDHVTITDVWCSAPLGNVPPPAGGPVVIGDGAYLGWGSVIGPGVTVGAGAFVGEGAVVLEDVAPRAIVYGNPARQVAGYGALG